MAWVPLAAASWHSGDVGHFQTAGKRERGHSLQKSPVAEVEEELEEVK